MTDQNEAEIAELQGLPREISPGRHVEDAVVRSLAARGVLRARPGHARWLAAAAVLLAFAGGMWLGRASSPVQRDVSLEQAAAIFLSAVPSQSSAGEPQIEQRKIILRTIDEAVRRVDPAAPAPSSRSVSVQVKPGTTVAWF